MSAIVAAPFTGRTPTTEFICLCCARIPLIRLNPHNSRCRGISSRFSPRSVREQRKEEREVELVNGYSWNGNGRIPGVEVAEKSENESLDGYPNGSAAANGSLVKYDAGSEVVVEEVGGVMAERKRKKRVEEIGKEDAWFKNPQEKQVM